MINTISNPPVNTTSDFYQDVISGLSRHPKKLSSKYFYDKKGDELFQEIMDLDEYYLTRAEFEIFSLQADTILSHFSPDGAPFNLIEFGAGDGLKTKLLLHYFTQKGANFQYLPIDISQNALDGLKESLKEEIPKLNIDTLQGDYFEVLDQLSHQTDQRNILLFLGSNIGNFNRKEAERFLTHVHQDLHQGDLLMIGVDLKKEPSKILSAYADQKGVTAEFNLNLLDRINSELDADFDKTLFEHYAYYDPITGECKSSLISTTDQTVSIHNHDFFFEKWEPIHTEISKKYSVKELEYLGKSCGFDIVENLFDQEAQFTDSIWRVK